MGIDINFDQLQQPNVFGNFLKGQEAGQKSRQDQARRAAYNVFSSDPAKAETLLMQSGDIEGASAVHKRMVETRSDAARTAAVKSVQAGDTEGAQASAIGAGDFDLARSIQGLSKEQRDAAKASAQQLGTIGMALKAKPYEERKAVLQQIAPALIHQGFKAEVLQSFDPTDQNIDMAVSQAQTVDQLIAQADKDRSFGLQEKRFGLDEKQFAEAKRHNKVGEGTAARNADTSAFSAQTGRMGFAERKKAGGFGTPGVGANYGANLDPNEWEIQPGGGK